MKKSKDNPNRKHKNVVFTATIIVVLSLLLSAVLCFGFACLLSYCGIKPASNFFTATILPLGISAIVFFIVFQIFTTRLATTEKELRKLLEELAKGNFDVQIPLTKNKYANKSIEDINKVLTELNSVKLMRTNFISDFSHEFKTPIINIHGFAELLLEEDISTADRIEYAQIIFDESNRLTNMAKNVLLLNKLNTQGIVCNKTRFSLDEQLRTCISPFMREITKKKLQVECNAAETYFNGDADLLSQVWTNLLSNAIKFSHPSGNLAITLKTEENSIVVEIADEGCGMDEETQKHIFDQFYQGDKSHSTDGNGLGLSIAKRIVEMCNGTISVRSARDVGTTFIVTLPAEE
jgi:signal transduction histidine kinase